MQKEPLNIRWLSGEPPILKNNKSMLNEPRRHHFIPQFILKNFADENGYLNYFNKETNKEEYLLPTNVFVRKNLYRDEKNNYILPIEIELDLSKFEGEVAPIIKKLLTGDIITLTKGEDEKLKLFIFAMDFRSERAMKNFVQNFKGDDKKPLAGFQPDGDMISYWKRNLAEIVKCRKINDVINNKRIDDYVRFHVLHDVGDCYLMIYRKKGKDNFVLSDTYPTVECFVNPFKIKFYNFYLPLSPERVLIAVNNIFQKDTKGDLIPSESFLYKPDVDENNLIFKVGKAFKNFVNNLNKISIDNCSRGYIFK